jgi:hypothetical protein
MNNSTHINTSIISLTSLILISFLSSCSMSKEPLGVKESRMSEELLRSQVLRYKAEVEEQNIEINKLSDECPVSYRNYPENIPFTPQLIERLMKECPELYEAMDQYAQSWSNYYLFYEKLKERGGDITELEIEDELFAPPKIFSPPIEDPAHDDKTIAEA